MPPATSLSREPSGSASASDAFAFDDEIMKLQNETDDKKPMKTSKAKAKAKGNAKGASPSKAKSKDLAPSKVTDKEEKKSKVNNHIIKSKDKKTKTFNRYCCARRKWFSSDGMGLNSGVCALDKRALDSMWHWAKVQQRMEWYKRMRESNDNIFKACTDFTFAFQTQSRRRAEADSRGIRHGGAVLGALHRQHESGAPRRMRDDVDERVHRVRSELERRTALG